MQVEVVEEIKETDKCYVVDILGNGVRSNFPKQYTDKVGDKTYELWGFAKKLTQRYLAKHGALPLDLEP